MHDVKQTGCALLGHLRADYPHTDKTTRFANFNLSLSWTERQHVLWKKWYQLTQL